MRKQFDNIPATPVKACKDTEGQYVLQVAGADTVARYADVQSVWEALDELDAPRAYWRAA